MVSKTEKGKLVVIIALMCVIIYTNAQNVSNPQEGGRPGNPGFEIRISPKGMKYAVRVAGNLLNSKIQHSANSLPGFHTSSARIWNLRIYEFRPPTYSYGVSAPNRLGWYSKGGKVSISGNWKVWKKIWFVPISKSGRFTSSASNLRVSISAALIRNSKGVMQLENVRCYTYIGHLSLNLHGGFLDWIIDRFSWLIADKVKPMLERRLCAQATEFVNNNVNAELRTFPTELPISPKFYLDYSLTSHPKMSEGSIVLPFKGEIRYYKNSEPLTFYPHKMQVQLSNSRMVYFYGSDYIMNSFLAYAHKYGLLYFTVDKKTFPSAADYLKTSCGLLDVCLGTLFEDIAAEYPNTFASARVETTADPTVLFTPGKAIVQVVGKLSLYIEGKKVKSLGFSFSADLKLKVTPDLEKVFGSIKINKFKLFGFNHVSADLIIEMAKSTLQKKANKLLKTGFPIPIIQGFQIKSAHLRLLKRTAELSADLSHT